MPTRRTALVVQLFAIVNKCAYYSTRAATRTRLRCDSPLLALSGLGNPSLLINQLNPLPSLILKAVDGPMQGIAVFEPANLSTIEQKVDMRHGHIWVDNLENTLGRSWGAIGRYQAAPGAPLAAARVLRRPWTAPTTIPGAGRGLMVTC